MLDSKPISTPLEPGIKLKKVSSTEEESFPYKELLGTLMYLAICSRPDIAYSVSYLNQFVNCYDSTHWIAAKRVLGYLKGIADNSLLYRKTSSPLRDYVDADWANCPDDRRSYTGYAFVLSGYIIS
ncbi:retrovirus-related pol polyprotein from transposon tnt 1-94 [Lasius niger]|uniref:Retrovirus-related pol polyprotein from transposon tnt 1-94 n=1 Tax=Lasius niger TaxID=67767 RepID=A0A0J7KAZ3_LASNI|nr:retrovirus-related pol polyprotein from transposon tnt 1-94 [Lasius niger]